VGTPASRPRARALVGRRLLADERTVATHLLLITGDRLSEVERSICIEATRPGAGPLGWRDRLRLAVAAGRLLGGSAP
jgi:hypothetical protein